MELIENLEYSNTYIIIFQGENVNFLNTNIDSLYSEV